MQEQQHVVVVDPARLSFIARDRDVKKQSHMICEKKKQRHLRLVYNASLAKYETQQ
jgi:hypothetical protein